MNDRLLTDKEIEECVWATSQLEGFDEKLGYRRVYQEDYAKATAEL